MTLFGSSFALLHLLLILSLSFHSPAVSSSNATDRLALLQFKSGITHDPFGVMASWNNSIHFCHWNGVTCGHRHQRVTVLNLRADRLAGSISPHIGNLSFLRILALHNNSFTGQIPRELGRLHRLQTLNLGNNLLVEGVPASLSSCLNLVGIALGDNYLSGSIPAELGFLMNLQKSKRGVPSSSENSLLQVSYQTLFRATEGFSSTNLIGVGSIGYVYKGVLDPQGIVSVKVFHLQQRDASRSFNAECEALKNIRHRNLVKVITACSSIDSSGNDFKAIVYEFMVNGNLDQWLHPTHGSTRKLNLLQRLSIAVDIACALDYLHRQYGQAPIVHCDLKPTNILLNDEMTAKVGDFGLMKFLSESTGNVPTSQTSTTGLKGTIGYAAPEYGTGSEVSTYGDMYSYGILLIEMFTAKRPTDDMFTNDVNLHNYVQMALPYKVDGIADPMLVQEAQDNDSGSDKYHKVVESLVLIFGIGIACSKESARERMNSGDALAELIRIRDKHVQITPRRHARDA